MRIIKRGLWSLLALLLALLVTIVSLMATSSGTRWLIQKVFVPLTAGQLTIGQVHGRLLTQVQVTQLQYHNPEVTLQIQQLTFAWQPWAILRWQLRVHNVSLKQLTLTLTPTLEKKPAPALVLAPLRWHAWWPALTIQQLDVQYLTVHKNSTPLLRLAQLQMQLMVDAHGLDWSSAFDHVAWQNTDALQDIQLQWHIKGPWTNYHVELAGKVAGQTWTLEGSGDRRQFFVNKLSGNRWPRDATLVSHLQWYPGLNVQTVIQAKALDLSTWFPVWPSKLDVNIQAQLAVDPHTYHVVQAALQINHWQGLWRGLPVSMQGAVTWQPTRLTVDHWRLQSGSAKVMADGVLAKQDAAFNWQLQVPLLGDLWPGAAGSIDSAGSVRTTLHDTWLQLHAAAHAVHCQTLRLADAIATLDFHSQDPGQFRVQLQGKAWSWADFTIDSVALNSQGDYAQHQVTLAFKAARVRINSQMTGSFGLKGWQGQWQRLDLQVPGQAQWSLKTAIPLQATRTNISMPKALCIQQGRQTTCIQANWQADTFWHVLLTSSQLNLTSWQFLLNPDWQCSGFVQGAVDVEQHGTALPRGSIDLKARDINLRYQPEAVNLNLGLFTARVNLEPTVLTAALTLDGALGQWKSALNLPKWQNLTNNWRQQSFQGSLTGQLTDLSRLPNISASMQQLQGKFTLALTGNGSLGAPKLQLLSQLSQGALRMPDLNIWLKPCEFTLRGDPLMQLTLAGSVQSGGGTINITGTADSLLTTPRVALSLRGQNFLASQLASYVVYLSPDLQLNYQAEQLMLKGNVVIPRAQLRFVEYQKSVVSLSSDVRYVGAKATAINFISTIHLSLGDQVTLQYGGLKGRVVGALSVHDEPNQPTTGVGQLQLVDSTYHAFGQLFTISQGLAQFTGGSVANPTLAISAIRKLTNVVPVSETGSALQSTTIEGVDDDLIVGVAMKGPLKTSQIELFSEPSGLSQADILSYMLLGRPTSEATGSGAQMLMSAASMLNNGNGASPVTQLQQQLKNSLGLDVNVGATSQMDKSTQSVTQNTSVILSKALSPRLFLNYSIGIVQPVNELKITYKMTPRWSAQSETSSIANGADIFYTINRH